MKIAILAVLCLTVTGINGQSFEETLRQAFKRFDTSTTIAAMTPASYQLEKLASKFPGNWATNFYSAYALIKLSFELENKSERDRYLDRATAYLVNANKLWPNSQEILILQAYAIRARVAVNGRERWRKYQDAYSDFISKARKINSENPRIYFLDGMEPFWKPKIFGGGKDKARLFFLKAKELFARENDSNILKPSWGRQANARFLKQCEE